MRRHSIIRAQAVIHSMRSEAEQRPEIPSDASSGGPTSFCSLNPMVATKRAGGRAGGASRG
eukprot:7521943-Alexandrium_andersonii.AAC.1